MKDLLYINLDFKKYQNKAKAQIKAFKNLKVNTTVATIENNTENSEFKIYQYQNGEFVEKYKKILTKAYIVEQGKNSLSHLGKRLIETIKVNHYFQKEIIRYMKENQFEYCYIRRIGFFVIFLSKMFRKISKTTEIIYEIPTYPLDQYDSWLINFSQKIEMTIFNLWIKKYIKIIPVILQNDTTLDKKMIPISNGIDFQKFADITEEKPSFSKEMNMIIIAHILSWHGYDRIIHSLKEYKGKTKVNLDIYSDINEEVKKLQKLTKDNHLDKIVHFKGSKPLEEITKEIGKYHIAIGSLGYHRRNGRYDTSIKNKEYCALGLPFVCSARDLSFEEDFPYIYMVSPDDTNFDIEQIIQWYSKIYKQNYKKEMRKYAKKELNFEVNYKKVLERLEKKENKNDK